MNLNTGYYRLGTLVMNRKLILVNYLKTWLFIDLVASLPFSWISDGPFFEKTQNDNSSGAMMAPKLLRLLKIFRFMRILKLLRVAKLTKILTKIEDHLSSNAVTNTLIYLRLLVGVFFIAHWTACMWHYLSLAELDLEEISWYNSCYIGDRTDPFEVYVAALYWAFTTMTTVGYGDIVPVTLEEKLFAMFAMLLACGVFAYTLGSISSLVSRQNKFRSEYQDNAQKVVCFMKKYNLPSELQFRVRRFFEYQWDTIREHHIEEYELLDLLSGPLKDEVCASMHMKVLMTCNIFGLFNPSFVVSLTKLIKMETFSPHDVVFEEGQLSRKLYFVKAGEVAVYHHKSNSVYIKLAQGKHFGEVSFFSNLARTASVVCLDFTILVTLNWICFEKAAQMYPDVLNKIKALQASCQGYKVQALGVKCYQCRQPGHVAALCPNTILHAGRESALRRWFESRKPKSKIIRIPKDFHERTKVKNYRQKEPNSSRYPEQPMSYMRLSRLHAKSLASGNDRGGMPEKIKDGNIMQFHSAERLSAKVSAFSTESNLELLKVPIDPENTGVSSERWGISSSEELFFVKRQKFYSDQLESSSSDSESYLG